jgi:DNA-binding CsgD family transcriptional regulator
MNSTATTATAAGTASGPISGLLSLVAGAIEPVGAGTPTAQVPDLSRVLGQLAGGWMTVKEDGQGWMLLQFAANAETAPVIAPVIAPDETPAPAGQVAVDPDFGARVRRVHTALTEREREVLVLVAGGATNRAIGQRLFISPKTASVHVSRILTKLDATTRTEAASLAHAAGLVQPWGAVSPAPTRTLQAV